MYGEEVHFVTPFASMTVVTEVLSAAPFPRESGPVVNLRLRRSALQGELEIRFTCLDVAWEVARQLRAFLHSAGCSDGNRCTALHSVAPFEHLISTRACRKGKTRRSEMAPDSTPGAISLPFFLPPLSPCQMALPSSSREWPGHCPLESAQTKSLASDSGATYTPHRANSNAC